jgi:hypothetical protein
MSSLCHLVLDWKVTAHKDIIVELGFRNLHHFTSPLRFHTTNKYELGW